MRRACVAVVLSALLVAGACGGDDDGDGNASPTSSTASTSTTRSTSTTSVTTVAPTTTMAPCPQAPPLPTDPIVSPVVGGAQLLTGVAVASDTCVDRVTFDFSSKTADPPSYKVEYQPGPFSEAGSGAPIAVDGQAFLVVRLEPAYGFDFESGQPSYTGPKRVTGTHADHVTEVVETGDFEAVMTWVIGLDSKRPLGVEATGFPHQLVVTIY